MLPRGPRIAVHVQELLQAIQYHEGLPMSNLPQIPASPRDKVLITQSSRLTLLIYEWRGTW